MPKPPKPSSSSRTAPAKGKGASSTQSDASVSSKSVGNKSVGNKKETKSKERPTAKAKLTRPQGESIGTGVIWLVIGTILLGFGVVGFLVYQELLNGTKRELLQTAQGQAQPTLKQFEQVKKTTENLAGKLQAVQSTKPKNPDPYRKALIEQADTVTAPLMGVGMVAVPNQLFKGNGQSPYVLRKEGATLPQGLSTQALPAPNNDKLVIANRPDAQKLPILANLSQPSWTNTYDSYGNKIIAFTAPITSGKQNVAAAYGELNLTQLGQSFATGNLGKANPDTTLLLVSPDGMIWGNTSNEGGGQTGQSYQTIPSLSNTWATLQTQGAVQSEGKVWVNTPLGINGWQVVAGTSEQKIWLRTLPIVGGAGLGTLVLVGAGMFWFLGSVRRRLSNVTPNTASGIGQTQTSQGTEPAHAPTAYGDNYSDNTAGDIASLNDHLEQQFDDQSLEYPEITTDLSMGQPASADYNTAPAINPVLGAAAVGAAVVGGVAVAAALRQDHESTSNPNQPDTTTDHYQPLGDNDPIGEIIGDIDNVPAESLMADYAQKYALPLDDSLSEPASSEPIDAPQEVSTAADIALDSGTNSSNTHNNEIYANQDVFAASTSTNELNSSSDVLEEISFTETVPSQTDLADLNLNIDAINNTANIAVNDYDNAFAPISESEALGVPSISEEEMLAMELAEANLAMDNLAQEGLSITTNSTDQSLSDGGFYFRDETILQSGTSGLENPLDMDYLPPTIPNDSDIEDDPFAPDPFQETPTPGESSEADPFGTMDLLGNVDRRAVEEESQLKAFDPLMETIGQNVNYGSMDEVFTPLPPLVPQLHESLDSIPDSEEISYVSEEIGEPDWGQTNNEYLNLGGNVTIPDDDNYDEFSYQPAEGDEFAAELLEDQFVGDQFDQFADQLTSEYAPYDPQYDGMEQSLEQQSDLQSDLQNNDLGSDLGNELGNDNLEGMDYAPELYDPATYDPAVYAPDSYNPSEYSGDVYGGDVYSGQYPPDQYAGTEYGTDPYATNYAEGYAQGMELDPNTYGSTQEQFQYFTPEEAANLVDYQAAYPESYQTDEYGQPYGTDPYVAEYATQDSAYDGLYEQPQDYNLPDDLATSGIAELSEPSLELDDLGLDLPSAGAFTNADPFAMESASLSSNPSSIGIDNYSSDSNLDELVSNDANILPELSDDAFSDPFSDISDDSFHQDSNSISNSNVNNNSNTVTDHNLISMGDETAFSFASLEDSLMSSNSSLEQITSGTAISDLSNTDDLGITSLPDEIDLDFLDSLGTAFAPDTNLAPEVPNLMDHLPDLSEDQPIDDIFADPAPSLGIGEISSEPSPSVSFFDVIPTEPVPSESKIADLDLDDPFNDSVFGQNAGIDSITDNNGLDLDPFDANPLDSGKNNSAAEPSIPAIPDLDGELDIDLDDNSFFDRITNDDLSNSLLELQGKTTPKSTNLVDSSTPQESEIDDFDFDSLSALDDIADDLLINEFTSDDFTNDNFTNAQNDQDIPQTISSLADQFDLGSGVDSLISAANQPKLTESNWDELSIEDDLSDDDFNFDNLMLEINKPLSPKLDQTKPNASNPPNSSNSNPKP